MRTESITQRHILALHQRTVLNPSLLQVPLATSSLQSSPNNIRITDQQGAKNWEKAA